MKKLETEKLILRKFRRKDLNDMYEISSTEITNIEDSVFAENSVFYSHTSKEDTLRVIESAMHDYGTYESCWAVEEKSSHKVIGHIRIDDASLKNKQCTIVWSLSPKCWGIEYGKQMLTTMFKYLFESHPFDIIVIKYYSNKIFSNSILEDSGMKRDAVLRDRRINSLTGEKESLVIYSILREELLS